MTNQKEYPLKPLRGRVLHHKASGRKPSAEQTFEPGTVPVRLRAGGSTTRHGVGRQICHVGEALQTVTDLRGSAEVAVGSIPCPRFSSEATLTLIEGQSNISVNPPDCVLSARVCEITLRKAGYTGGGRLELHSNIPVGKGMGSSSADAIATYHAVCDAMRIRPALSDAMKVLREAGESGVDSTVTGERASVVASRRFEQIVDTERRFPYLLCLAFDSAPETIIETRSTYCVLPTDPFVLAKGTFLLKTYVKAIRAADYRLLGKVMTASARDGQRYLFNELLESTIAVGTDTGSLGCFRAHTGTLLGLAWDPRTPHLESCLLAAENKLLLLGSGKPFRFSTRDLEEVIPNEIENAA